MSGKLYNEAVCRGSVYVGGGIVCIVCLANSKLWSQRQSLLLVDIYPVVIFGCW